MEHVIIHFLFRRKLARIVYGLHRHVLFYILVTELLAELAKELLAELATELLAELATELLAELVTELLAE